MDFRLPSFFGQPAYQQPAPPGMPPTPGAVLVVYLQTEQQGYALVQPNLGSGAYGHCSLWVGLKDQKLKVRKLQWSTMHEFVSSQTLLSVLDSAITHRRRIPEPVIWQCGATLVEIAYQMRFPANENSYPMTHEDIYHRNILVSEGKSHQTNTFLLIDFGVASRAYEKVVQSNDFLSISHTLHEMMTLMLNGDPRRQAEMDRGSRFRPYTTELYLIVDRLFAIGRSIKTLGTKPCSSLLVGMISKFRLEAQRKTEEYKAARKEYKISIPDTTQNVKPWTATGYNAVEQLQQRMKGQKGCQPCQMAWLDPCSCRVIEVIEDIHWARPEYEPMLTIPSLGW